MERSLIFLTKQDRDLLLEAGEIRRYAEGEVVLEEGSARQSLFIILDGSVQVERAGLGRGIELATLGPGDLFGEMSFLEGAPSSADVVCKEVAEILIIEGQQVLSRLQSVPGLASRSYQSLAVLLSRRLRTTTDMIPALLVEDIPRWGRSKPTGCARSIPNGFRRHWNWRSRSSTRGWPRQRRKLPEARPIPWISKRTSRRPAGLCNPGSSATCAIIKN